ncbi:MAG: NADH-ubiquinone oxidoreductase-F iron-sulfur binding region domain-containing protein [Candidatus Auribacterota bacterium]|jgi:[NiFe] hydrogenase diaphorase moiety large subunit|nr:NADH-ubiquinone oxidoreductase-F iron-sulfur binding region domain-containing protein [Candidatus Auribacterota bacterium]
MVGHKIQILFSPAETGIALRLAIGKKPEDIIAQVKESKLRGRGGAGFPTGLKWELVQQAKGERKFVVCNADEGEPGTFKDRILLTDHPCKIFEGMAICGYAVGAQNGVVYLRAEYRYLREGLVNAIKKMKESNYLGKNIMGSGFNFDIEIHLGAGAYVCGEETALLESLEGKRGEARNKPPYPTECGYMGCPTVVNNVETFCYVPAIMTKGAQWFSEIGTMESTGSKLFSISGDVAKPGVYELAMGSTVDVVLQLVGAKDTKAVQVGGASGICVAEKDFNKPISFESLPPGGSIIVFNKSRDMLYVLKNFMEFFVEESCGQCTPCREGTYRLLQGVEMMEQGRCSIHYLHTLRDLAQTMLISSKCGLGQLAPNPFLSIIDNFKGEILARDRVARNSKKTPVVR